MAFINKKTFDIIQDSNIRGYLKNYFEVDDMLAEPIQVLNRKGYVTSYSCAGHPYESVNMSFAVSATMSVSEVSKLIRGTYKVNKVENGRYRICFKCFLLRRTYIVFEKGIKPPNVPEGFTFKDRILSINYDNAADNFFENQLAAIKRLTEWAMALPERKA